VEIYAQGKIPRVMAKRRVPARGSDDEERRRDSLPLPLSLSL